MDATLRMLLELWSSNLYVDLRRYIVFATAVWLVLWVMLRVPLRRRKIREETPPVRQLISEFLHSLRSMALFSTGGVAMILADRAGYYPLPHLAKGWGAVWFWVSVLAMVISHDAYFYWTHRLIHDPRLFRRFHRRHHKSNNPSPFTAYSFDVGEAAVLMVFMIVWPLVFPTSWAASGLFMLHQIVRNTLLHSGYELMPPRRDGRPWLDFLTTTTHHDLHHAQARWNYASWFTWWDRWMGTEHPEYLERYRAAVGWRGEGTASDIPQRADQRQSATHTT